MIPEGNPNYRTHRKPWSTLTTTQHGTSLARAMVRSIRCMTYVVLPDMVRFSCIENLLCQVEPFTSRAFASLTLCSGHALFGRNTKLKKRCSGAPCTHQRSLYCILAQCPITASSTCFCVLCCQPVPLRRSLTARASQFTP